MTSDPTPCGRCGEPHAACAGHKRNGRPCGQPSMIGGTVCRMHGGMAPQVIAAAERRMRERDAILAVETYGLPRDIDPQSALLEEVHRTAGHVAWLSAVVAGIEKGDLVWGKTKEKEGGDDHGVTYESKPSIWLSLYQAERKHLTEVCRVAISAGIEERRVRLAESQGALLAGVIDRVLRRLDLSPAQQLLVGEVVPAELRAVAEIEAGAVGA